MTPYRAVQLAYWCFALGAANQTAYFVFTGAIPAGELGHAAFMLAFSAVMWWLLWGRIAHRWLDALS